MTRLYTCPNCRWSSAIPGKNKTCKRCGQPVEVSHTLTPVQIDHEPTRLVGSPQAVRCNYTGLPYRDLTPGENPDVRLYLNGTPNHYGMIFRNRIHVKDLYCPKCNKLTATNAKLEGQFEHVCKNTLSREQGGKPCRANITYIFIRDKAEEKNVQER